MRNWKDRSGHRVVALASNFELILLSFYSYFTLTLRLSALVMLTGYIFLDVVPSKQTGFGSLRNGCLGCMTLCP